MEALPSLLHAFHTAYVRSLSYWQIRWGWCEKPLSNRPHTSPGTRTHDSHEVNRGIFINNAHISTKHNALAPCSSYVHFKSTLTFLKQKPISTTLVTGKFYYDRLVRLGRIGFEAYDFSQSVKANADRDRSDPTPSAFIVATIIASIAGIYR